MPDLCLSACLQRQLKMTATVFKSGNCRQVADGVRQLMEVMENILEGDSPATLPAPSDIRQRLDSVARRPSCSPPPSPPSPPLPV